MNRSARVETALNARANSTNDFFGGWTEDDLPLLDRWAAPSEALVSERGILVDWLGIRTRLSNHAWLPVPPDGGIVVGDIPVPDDSVHAETIEYVALLTGIERARQRGLSYTMFELGSSYAPWTVAAAHLALRAGCTSITATAVEANKSTIPKIHDHVKLNSLDQRPGVQIEAIHAAVHITAGTMYFPKIDTSIDNGAQATANPSRTDYRGVSVTHDEVPARSLADLCRNHAVVDFVHLDLQGAEEQLLADDEFLDTLHNKVACVMLATQSRLIEGMALRALGAGWELLRERPTMFTPTERTSDVNGWTTRDGAQLWVNRRFRA